MPCPRLGGLNRSRGELANSASGVAGLVPADDGRLVGAVLAQGRHVGLSGVRSIVTRVQWRKLNVWCVGGDKL